MQTIEELGEKLEQLAKEMAEEMAEGRYQMMLDHQKNAVLHFRSNNERVAALQRWFPVEYRKMQKYHMWFLEEPDNYPEAVVTSINHYLSQLIPPSAFNELRFH